MLSRLQAGKDLSCGPNERSVNHDILDILERASGPSGRDRFRLELASAVADEARPNGASSLAAGKVVGGW